MEKSLWKFLISCVFLFFISLLWVKSGYFKFLLYLISGIVLMLLPTSNLLPTIPTGLGWYYADRFLFLSIIVYSLLLTMSCALLVKCFVLDNERSLVFIKRINNGSFIANLFIIIGLFIIVLFAYFNLSNWKSIHHWGRHQQKFKIEAPALIKVKIKDLSDSKRYDEALALSMAVLPKTDGQFPYLKVIILEQILDVYIKKGDYTSALEYFNLIWAEHVFHESGRSKIVKNKNKLRMSVIGASLNFQLNRVEDAQSYIKIADATIEEMTFWERNESLIVIKQLSLIKAVVNK